MTKLAKIEQQKRKTMSVMNNVASNLHVLKSGSCSEMLPDKC
jgi:hypothetical protein